MPEQAASSAANIYSFSTISQSQGCNLQAISKPGEEGLHFEVFKAEAEAEKARLRLEIQHCRDDAAAELQALQELNTSLSGRSNLHQVNA